MTFKNIYQNVSLLWTALFHCVWASVCERVCVWGWASLFLDRGKSRRGIRQVWCVYEAVAPRRMTHRDVSGASQWPCTLSVINFLCLVLGWPTKLSPKNGHIWGLGFCQFSPFQNNKHSNVYMLIGCAFIVGKGTGIEKSKRKTKQSVSQNGGLQKGSHYKYSLFFLQTEILLLRGKAILIFWQTELLFIHFLFWLCAGQQNFGVCECKKNCFPLSSDTMTAVSAVTRAKWGEEQSSIQGYEFLISGGSAAPTAGLQ